MPGQFDATGQHPINVEIHPPDAAIVKFEKFTGSPWRRVCERWTRLAFMDDGQWFWRDTGGTVNGWALIDLERAWRLHRRSQVEEAQRIKRRERRGIAD